MHLNIPNILEKTAILEQIATKLKSENFTVINQDINRPWGGFFCD